MFVYMVNASRSINRSFYSLFIFIIMLRAISKSMTQMRLNAGQSLLPVPRAFATTSTSGDHLNKFGAKKNEVSPFSSDSNIFLITKYMTYQLCRFPFFVQNAQTITNGMSKIFGKFSNNSSNRQEDHLLFD